MLLEHHSTSACIFSCVSFGRERFELDAEDFVLLGSDATCSGDEVYLETDSKGRLIRASKDASTLTQVDAELVGISKLSLPAYEALCALMESSLESNPKLDYEGALAAIGADHNIVVKRVDGLVWCEIDDATHLERALTKILPRIEASQRKAAVA